MLYCSYYWNYLLYRLLKKLKITLNNDAEEKTKPNWNRFNENYNFKRINISEIPSRR